jgi:hypothetical protein
MASVYLGRVSGFFVKNYEAHLELMGKFTDSEE